MITFNDSQIFFILLKCLNTQYFDIFYKYWLPFKKKQIIENNRTKQTNNKRKPRGHNRNQFPVFQHNRGEKNKNTWEGLENKQVGQNRLFFVQLIRFIFNTRLNTKTETLVLVHINIGWQ